MKLGLNRGDLADVVTWAARALPARPTLPVLAGLRLDGGDGTLKASAFDYDTAAAASTDARVDEPGTVLLPGRLLHEVTAALEGEVAEIELDDDMLVLRCDGSTFRLATLPMDEYPDLPPMPPVAGRCDAAALAREVLRVAPAAGRDDTLPVLTGVNFMAQPDALVLQATDRYRAALGEVPWTAASADGAELRAVVNAKLLAGLLKELGAGEVTISFERASEGASLFGLTAGGRQLLARCIPGEFPNIQRFVETPAATTITADAAGLRTAVRRAALATTGTSPPEIRLSASAEGLTLEAAGEGRAASELVAAQVDGDSAEVKFRADFLADGLAAAGGTIRLGLADGFGPAVLASSEEDDAYRHALMPIRG